MSVIGYARVSTREQNPDSQVAELEAAGAARVFVDVDLQRATLAALVLEDLTGWCRRRGLWHVSRPEPERIGTSGDVRPVNRRCRRVWLGCRRRRVPR